MAKINDKEACQIHGIVSSDSDSDVDTRREIDEEYNLLKPPPLDLDENKIIVISSEITTEVNVWEERLKTIQNNEETKTQTDTSVASVPKKKKKKKSKSSNKTENGDTNKINMGLEEINKSEDKEANVASKETNPVCGPSKKKPKVKISDNITDPAQIKESDRKSSTPENEPVKITYDPETLKNLGEELDRFDKKKIWPYRLDDTTIVQQTNSQCKTDSNYIPSCFKATVQWQGEENNVKKKTKWLKFTEKFTSKDLSDITNDVNKESTKSLNKFSENKSSRFVLDKEKITDIKNKTKHEKPPAEFLDQGPTKFAGNQKTFLQELEYVFGEDFKDFIQSAVRDGTSISDLSSFTYGQLYSAYKAYRQKRNDNGLSHDPIKNGLPVKKPPVQQNSAPLSYRGDPNHTTTLHPAHQNNVNWNYVGNQNMQNNINWNYAQNHQKNTTWSYPGTSSTNTMFCPPQQNNPNWYYLGNPNPNLLFFFYETTNQNAFNPAVCAASPSEKLQLMEIKEDENLNRGIKTPVSNKKLEAELKNKTAQPAEASNGGLENKREMRKENVNVVNTAQKDATKTESSPEMSNILTARSDNVQQHCITLENNKSDKKKSKQVTDDKPAPQAVTKEKSELFCAASSASGKLQSTEMKEDENLDRGIKTSVSDKKLQIEPKKKTLQRAGASNGDLEKKQEILKENVSVVNTVQKDATKTESSPEMSNIQTARSDNVQQHCITLENKKSNKKKSKQVTDDRPAPQAVIKEKFEFFCAETSNGGSEKKQETRKENVSVINTVQKDVTKTESNPDMPNILTARCDIVEQHSITINKESNKKTPKQVTDDPQDDRPASQAVINAKFEVKSIPPCENFFYSQSFDSALNSYMQAFAEGAEMVTDAKQVEKFVDRPSFSKCKQFVIDFLQFNDSAYTIINRCLKICTVISNERNNNHDPVIVDNRKVFAREFQYSGMILNDCIEGILNSERNCLTIYNKAYNRFLRYVILTRVNLGMCKQTCDAINEEIEKSGWGNTNEIFKDLTPRNSFFQVDVPGTSSQEYFTEERFTTSSSEELKTDRKDDNERLSFGLENSTGSIKSHPEIDGKRTLEYHLKTKETICDERKSTDSSDNLILNENLILHSSTTEKNDHYSTDWFGDHVQYHLNGLELDLWWCHLAFIALTLCLMVKAARGVISFMGDNIYYICAAFVLYIYLTYKK